MLEFYVPACPACRSLAPKLRQLAADNPDVDFVTVNGEASAEMSAAVEALGVDRLPYFAVYRKDGGERVSAFAHTLTFWWSSAGLDYYLGYVDNMKKVTREQIARYLDTYVLGSNSSGSAGKPLRNFVFGSLVSPDMAKQGFDKTHFEVLAGLKPAPNAKAAK